jgi:hypothetical protein
MKLINCEILILLLVVLTFQSMHGTGDRDVASLLTNWVVPQHLLKKASDGKQNIFFLGKIYETQRSCSLKTNITPPN